MNKKHTKLLLAPILLLLVFGVNPFYTVQAQDDGEMAQMRIIGTPKVSSGDIIADRDDNRDINGNLTAGLRIITDLTGVQYRSNNGILKAQQDPGSTLLYLSANERVVTAYKDGFPPLTIVLNDEGINLEAGKVWEMQITGNQRTTNEAVRFEVTPENSTLIIDGRPVQMVGTTFDTSLSTGQHFIEIRKDRHEFIEDSINVVAQTVNSWEYSLDRIDPVRVQINSTPQGASIYLNDSPGSAGTTPHYVNIFPGDLKVELRLEGYSTLVDELIYTPDIGNSLTYNLSKYEGYLTINTTPEDAIVLIDGTRVTQKENIPLVPGVKTLEIRATGYDAVDFPVEIEQGDTLTVERDLNQITGNLYVTIQQGDAELTMTKDGQVVEQWQGFKNFTDYPVGTYQIEAKLTNFRSETRTVELTRNAEETVDFNLQQIDGKGSLVVDAVFRDAEVKLKGPGFTRNYDELPLNLPSLPFGKYEIEIEKEGFDEITKQIEINSLSQELTVVDEFEPRGKGGALFRSLFIPGTGHGYLGKGGRGFLYFLGSAGAIGYTVNSYLEYEKHFKKYEAELLTYNNASPGSNFEILKENYRDAYKKAQTAQEGIVNGLTILAAVKGLETLDLLLQRSNKKLLQEAKVDFNARNNGISMRINF